MGTHFVVGESFEIANLCSPNFYKKCAKQGLESCVASCLFFALADLGCVVWPRSHLLLCFSVSFLLWGFWGALWVFQGCIFPVVFAQFLLFFFHQILLYCLLLLGASLHLCLALPHPWLSVETLVVVCHRRNIKRFFLQIHHSKFPPRCFAVSTLCNWCLIFRIFLCASMFVHASMRLNQKNATLCGQQITQTKNSTKRVSLPEGSTK